MASSIEICNLALANIGITKAITSFSEESQEAAVCKQFFEQARDEMLRAGDWSFATTVEALADTGETPVNWEYQYSIPSDCLKVIGLVVDGITYPRENQKIPFIIGYSSSAGAVIKTNQKQAVAKYIAKIDNSSFFDPLFVNALAWSVAAKIAMPLTVKVERAQLAAEQAARALSVAEAADANEGMNDDEPTSEMVSVRFN